MKTTQGKATAAYVTLANMGARTLPANTAYRLFKVKKALLNAYEFEVEQEKKYMEECQGELDGTGMITFKDVESRKAFEEKKKEMHEVEIDVEMEVPTVPLGEMKEVSMLELESLEGFVNFK